MGNPTPKSTGSKSPNAAENRKPNGSENDLVEAIKGELLDVVPRRQVDAVSERISHLVVSEYYSGPLPHPRHLAQYDSLIPNGAERVMGMAESALSHNQTMHAQMLAAEIDDRKLGMWMGLGSFFLLIVVAILALLVADSEVGAALFLAAAAISVVGTFVNGRGKNGKP